MDQISGAFSKFTGGGGNQNQQQYGTQGQQQYSTQGQQQEGSSGGFLGGFGGNQSQQQTTQNQQQQGSSGGFFGGLGDKFNSAAGGGRESEKNEDMLDKGMTGTPSMPQHHKHCAHRPLLVSIAGIESTMSTATREEEQTS